VKDMARAIGWAITRDVLNGGEFLAVNVGSDEWNYQVKDLAEAVARVIPNIEVSINKDAQPDKRSYRVNFDLFKKLAPSYQLTVGLIESIKELKDGLEAMRFKDGEFRNSKYMRLNILTDLQKKGLVNENLQWINK
jgi:nucleoside-diphosphate-sugar epimerase